MHIFHLSFAQDPNATDMNLLFRIFFQKALDKHHSEDYNGNILIITLRSEQNMKKVIALLLMLVLLVGIATVFTACEDVNSSFNMQLVDMNFAFNYA